MQHDGWTISQESSLLKIDPAEWARVAHGRSLYFSHPWLLAIENDEENRDAVSYLLIRQDGILRAALPVYRRERPGYDDFYDPIAQFLELEGAERAPSEDDDWYPLLLGGTVAAYWNDLLVDRQAPAEAQAHARQLLFFELDRKRAGGAAGLMFTLPEAAQHITEHWGPRAASMFVGAQATFEVSWNSMDEYVRSLPNHRRRNAVRRELRQFTEWRADKGTTSLRACHERLIPLIANLQRKYDHEADEAVICRQLSHQAAHLDGYSTVFTCALNGKIVAFTLLYEWENELYVRSAGFDYDAVDHTTGAYFNLAYYEPIRYAIEHGFTRIHLGMGTYAAKAARGAKLTPCWSVVMPSDTLSATDARLLADFERDSVAHWQAKHQVDLTPADMSEQ